MDLYNTSALFHQNMSDHKQIQLKNFYHKVFHSLKIKTIHDCSIGAGGTTLPLKKIGYEVSGSDLSENLLKKAKENFSQAGYDIPLFVSDFRDIKDTLKEKYDCILSTGNSLPHIKNDEISNFVKDIYHKINDGGYLYIDMRNWDKVLDEKPIFQARHPLVMTAQEHTSLYQIWNWHDDGSVNFIFVNAKDRDGKHVESSLLHAPTYYPLKFSEYCKMLESSGFIIIECFDMDPIFLNETDNLHKTNHFKNDFHHIQWYGILAKKI